MTNERILITVREVMEMTGTSRPTIYAWTEIEGFPLVKIGRRKLVHREGFMKWIAERANVCQN